MMLGDVVICHRKLLFIIACLSLQSIEKNVHMQVLQLLLPFMVLNHDKRLLLDPPHWVAPLIMAASSSGLYEDGNALKMSYSPAAMCSRIL